MPSIPGVKFARRSHTSRTALIAGTAGFAFLTWFIARYFLDELAARALAIFVVAAVFWATETLPLFATAFLIIGMEIIFLATDGGFADHLSDLLRLSAIEVHSKYSISSSTFFAPFAKDIIILFMGGFLLAKALTKHHIDVAVARRLLKPLSHSPAMLLFGVLLITAFFSMWMSNTATTAMMLAIIFPLVRNLPENDKFHRGLVLAVAFGANIGGIGTPIGTPPNAIAYGALNAAGYDITFLQWMMIAVPLECFMLLITGIILLRAFPPTPGTEMGEMEYKHEITTRGWMTVTILLLTVALWLTGGWHGIKPGAVALLAAAGLTSLAILDRRDVDSIDWNLLILMWGGLSLSVALRATHLDQLIAAVDFTQLPGDAWTVAALVTVVAVLMSTFMSNTATAALLVPMTLAISIDSREQYAMLAALACSFAMAMPVSTPPNAMAYATGKVPINSMIRVGAIITIIAVITLLLGYQIMLPLVFPSDGAG